jgi:hypothetical protein
MYKSNFHSKQIRIKIMLFLYISIISLFGFKSDSKSNLIIANCIENQGGITAIAEIKDITIKAKIKKNGIIFDEITYHKRPNKFLLIQSFKGVEFKRIYSNGYEIKIINTDSKGHKIDYVVNEKSVKMTNIRQSPFKIIEVEKFKPVKTYKGIITVGKTSCHEIEYKLDRAVWNCYFDTKTGLLLSETEVTANLVNGIESKPVQKLTQNLGFIPINDVYFVLKSKIFENKIVVSENDYYGFEVNKNLKDEIFNPKK